MNLNDEEEDLFFKQRCLELAKLLRTEQTEDFLHLYDSLPSEWNGSRVSSVSITFFVFSRYLMRNIYSLNKQKNVFVNYKNSTRTNFNVFIKVHFLTIRSINIIKLSLCQICQ